MPNTYQDIICTFSFHLFLTKTYHIITFINNQNMVPK
ncbi:hypothetical protein F383_05820 [Gossypium arboreum]|uniref:Uncharacterized protein n=1 Tax=Gossypium arboreum TaxID=29729 RepID=A0A0B0PFV3_GOSAR|nr:hypothetical protein F383_05820 [Gossypium arboreum]